VGGFPDWVRYAAREDVWSLREANLEDWKFVGWPVT